MPIIPKEGKTMSMSEELMGASVALERMKGDIVTGTLDALNSSQYSGSRKSSGASDAMAQSYDFQQSVLSSVYSAKGAAVDKKS